MYVNHCILDLRVIVVLRQALRFECNGLWWIKKTDVNSLEPDTVLYFETLFFIIFIFSALIYFVHLYRYLYLYNVMCT